MLLSTSFYYPGNWIREKSGTWHVAGAEFKLRYSYLLCQRNKSVTSLFLRKTLFLLRISLTTFWENANNNEPKLNTMHFQRFPLVFIQNPCHFPLPPPKKNTLRKKGNSKLPTWTYTYLNFPLRLEMGTSVGSKTLGLSTDSFVYFYGS